MRSRPATKPLIPPLSWSEPATSGRVARPAVSSDIVWNSWWRWSGDFEQHSLKMKQAISPYGINCTQCYRSIERGLLLTACLCSQTAKHRSTSFCYLTRAIFFVSHFFRFLGPSFTRKSARFSTFAECDDSRDPRDKRRKYDGKLGTGKVTYDEEEDGVNKFQVSSIYYPLMPEPFPVLSVRQLVRVTKLYTTLNHRCRVASRSALLVW